MRLVTFTLGNGPPRAGALLEGGRRVLDLQGCHRARYRKGSAALASVLAMVEGGDRSLEIAAGLMKRPAKPALLPLGEVKLLAPIPRPPQMRDFLCFEQHLVQAFKAIGRTPPQAWYERPLFYHPSRFSVCGTDTDVAWPAYSDKIDFELEFGCYIGRAGRDIPKEKAREHVFGYTIFNDFSARDEQAKDMAGQLGPGKGKDFDNANAMGPCLVTADEIGDPYRLEMRVRVNGEEWGRGNSRDMHWKFEDCIAHASRSETLHPGEFFGSGTVGNGCGLESLRFLKPGDSVELEVEGIGILRNRVVK